MAFCSCAQANNSESSVPGGKLCRACEAEWLADSRNVMAGRGKFSSRKNLILPVMLRRFPSLSIHRQIPNTPGCRPRLARDNPPKSPHAIVRRQWRPRHSPRTRACRAPRVCRGKPPGQAGFDLKAAFAYKNTNRVGEVNQARIASQDTAAKSAIRIRHRAETTGGMAWAVSRKNAHSNGRALFQAGPSGGRKQGAVIRNYPPDIPWLFTRIE